MLRGFVMGTLQTIILLQICYAPFEYSLAKYFDFMIECNIQN